MELQNKEDNHIENPFPFNNLFLIKGFVTGKNDFWRYVLGIFLAFTGYLTFQLIIMTPLLNAATKNGLSLQEIKQNPNVLFDPNKVGIDKNILLALMMGMFVFAFVFLWIAIKFIQQKSLSSIMTGFDAIRWKRYFFSFGLWGTLIVVMTISSYLLAPQDIEVRFNPIQFSILFLVSIIFIPIQTAVEELIFRGYLMQGLSLAFKNGVFPLLLTSIVFGLMHGSNPEVKEYGLLLMMPYYIFFALFLAIITLLDEGLELAMGIHCANNLFSGLLVCSKNSVLQTDAIFYSKVENPATEFLISIILLSLCFFILLKKYKLSNWKLIYK